MFVQETIMEEKLQTAGPLKKISIALLAGASMELKDCSSAPEQIEFIYGIGIEGLTPFECAIDGKMAGEEGVVEVHASNRNEFFGHLMGCASKFSIDADPFYLHFKIHSVSATTPREVVKAMAGDTGCGGNCDCGCGIH
jgi:hypothetical protein